MRHDKRVKNYWNRALKKLFKELSSKRFSISVFIFEKHCTALFNFGKDHLGSVTNWVRRKCNFSVICFGMRRPSGRPQPSLQALSLFPCCYQTDEIPSTGMSTCHLKEKLDCLREIQQGKDHIVRISSSDDVKRVTHFIIKIPIIDHFEYGSVLG